MSSTRRRLLVFSLSCIIWSERSKTHLSLKGNMVTLFVSVCILLHFCMKSHCFKSKAEILVIFWFDFSVCILFGKFMVDQELNLDFIYS